MLGPVFNVLVSEGEFLGEGCPVDLLLLECCHYLGEHPIDPVASRAGLDPALDAFVDCVFLLLQ